MKRKYLRFSIVALVLVVAVASVAYWLRINERSVAQPSAKQAASTVVLRFGHNFHPNSALHVAAEKFAETMRNETGGRVEVTIHPAQQLGNDDKMIEMTRDGTLDIMLVPTAKLSAAVPAMQYADLPFFFRDRGEAYRMLDGEPGRLLLEKLNAIDLVGVTIWENGFKHFTTNRPIREPDDFNGLKIRAMKSRIIMDQFLSLNAQPLLIDFYETRQALKNGVVDGQENPLTAIVNMGFHEVQSHLTLSGHGYLGYVFVISRKVIQSLPSEVGALLIDVARRVTHFEREETQRREAEFLDVIRHAGVTVSTLTEEQRARFAARVAHIPLQFEGAIGADILSKTEELMREGRAGADDDILIGLDADLSAAAAQAGLAIKRGARLAIDEINERGGVLGRRLALVARDHRGVPERGIRNIQDMAARPNLVAILAGSSSTVAIEEVETIHQTKVPLLVPWATATKIVDNGRSPNFIFRLSVSDSYSGSFLISNALARGQRVALLLTNNEWGRNNHASLTEALQRRNMTPTIVEWFNSGERDFSAHLSRIERAEADVLVVVASATENAGIINTAANRRHPLPMVSHWGMSSGTLREDVRSALSKVDLTFIQTFSFLTSQSPRTAETTRRYLDTFHVPSAAGILAPAGTAHAYDLVHLLALAITAAGTTDREAVRDALERIDTYAGLVKTHRQPFTPDRHEALGMEDYYLGRFDPTGAIVPATP
ncbi:MAG: DctP family TRAP transporter solute-binding subunit [Alphaproteobacteria bacterium]